MIDRRDDGLREAAFRFGNFVAAWSNDPDPASGLSKADADTIGGHVDRVLIADDPHVPLLLVPEDPDQVAPAFARLATFAAAWPADRVDAASKLSKADLDRVLAAEGESGFGSSRGRQPPDIRDGMGGGLEGDELP